MGKYEKLILTILIAKSDNNIRFEDLCNLLLHLGFDERIKGSHHIFSKADMEEIINIQPNENNKSKAYQVKQIRNLIIKYKMGELDA